MNSAPTGTGPDRAEVPVHPLESLVAHLPGLIYRCRYDHRRTFEYASAGSHALLGVTAPLLLHAGTGLAGFIYPQDLKRVVREIAGTLDRQDAFTCTYRIRRQGARQLVVVQEQGRAVRDGQGRILALEGYIGALENGKAARRNRVDPELQLQQSRAFSSINMLARGVSHDFSNVVAGISSSADLIKMDAGLDQSSSAFLDLIIKSARQAETMVHQLRYFSQRRPCKRSMVRLPAVVERALQLFQANLPASVELVQKITAKCPTILGDAEHIQLAVLNLCINAQNSLTNETGRIEVTLEPCVLELELSALPLGLHAGRYLRLCVRDNGAPFTKSLLERMYEPFACKQPGGYNSGMNLFIVREIAHAHDGAATVESSPAHGTVFSLYLPIP